LAASEFVATTAADGLARREEMQLDGADLERAGSA
jgi:hypothetical protein